MRSGKTAMTDALIAPRLIARLVEDWPDRGRPSPSKPKKGALIRIDDRDHQSAWSRLSIGGYRERVADLAIERNPPLSHCDFDALLDFYLAGHAPLPNLKPVELERGLDAIAAGASLSCWPSVAHVLLPRRDRSCWARVFTASTQGGIFDGTGYLIAYQGWIRPEVPSSDRVYSFALCAHEKVVGSGANPSRGWHPGHCPRCGLDLTVDSGD
jgi:hypothetical protein